MFRFSYNRESQPKSSSKSLEFSFVDLFWVMGYKERDGICWRVYTGSHNTCLMNHKGLGLLAPPQTGGPKVKKSVCPLR